MKKWSYDLLYAFVIIFTTLTGVFLGNKIGSNLSKGADLKTGLMRAGSGTLIGLLVGVGVGISVMEIIKKTKEDNDPDVK